VKGPAGITLESVSKRYVTPQGEIAAIESVSLEVEPGSSLAITGPSGCGKSTLLGLIAGLERPSGGRVLVGGEEVSSLPANERADLRRNELGLVFQRDNLSPFLTAVENVALQLALKGDEDGWDRCLEVLEELGLASQADRLPDRLSGGERQRIAIACALVKEPSVILADEPTGSLDARNSAAVIELLIQIQRRAGTTLVVVTHDVDLALHLDRSVGLRDGHVTMMPAEGRSGGGRNRA
jgi:putative ABC transport system ATP-binding protein